ncbi:MAG: hypothetical protein ACK4GJ_03660 [bacterium]
MNFTPDDKETKVLLATLAWGLLVGPAMAFLAIALKVNRPLAPVIVAVWYGGLIVGLVIFLRMYLSRLARELGVVGVIAAIIWIMIPVLFTVMIRSCS